VDRQVSVKRKYRLSVTAAEKAAAMHRVLATCPNRLLAERTAKHRKAATASSIS